MVDRQRVAAMLANLERYVSSLRKLAAMPRDQFLAGEHLIASAKYHFTIAIQCCLDVAAHVIASEGLAPADSYAGSFAVLVKEGILPADMQETYEDMAKFRNRLVHVYYDVDDKRVYRFLQEVLGDFDTFAAAIAKVGGEEGPP